MEADAPLRRAAGRAVLHPVPGEDLHVPVVHHDGQAHRELPFGVAHKFIFILRHAQLFRRLVQHMQHVFIRIILSHRIHLVYTQGTP